MVVEDDVRCPPYGRRGAAARRGTRAPHGTARDTHSGRGAARTPTASADRRPHVTAIPQGRDWTRMKRADFDDCAPLNLVDAAVCRPVPAVPDECGTQPLFGKDPKPPRPRRPRTPDRAPAEDLENTDLVV